MKKQSTRMLLAALLAASVATPAPAAILIYTSAGVVQPSDNVLFSNLGPAATIVAPTQHGNAVSFTGLETLNSASGGQARISGADGNIQYLSFVMANSALGMREVEFLISEIVGRNRPRNNQATVTFFDQNNVGTSITNFALTPGNDWFAASTTLGSIITRVQIATSANVDSIRQVRVEGVQLQNAVPEPATWAMMLAGFGLVAGAMRRRRPAFVLS
jgi:hypothetical protein